MARKKEPAKPLFEVKRDFVDSLDAFLQRSIILLQAIESALQHDQIKDGAKPILEREVAAFRSALLTRE